MVQTTFLAIIILYIVLYISVVCISPQMQLCLPSTCKCIKMYRNMLVFTGEYVLHWHGKQMSKYIKETPRRKITVTSSSYEISTDQQGKRMVRGDAGRHYSAPFYSSSRIHGLST
jgi:hypothetical protein